MTKVTLDPTKLSNVGNEYRENLADIQNKSQKLTAIQQDGAVGEDVWKAQNQMVKNLSDNYRQRNPLEQLSIRIYEQNLCTIYEKSTVTVTVITHSEWKQSITLSKELCRTTF